MSLWCVGSAVADRRWPSAGRLDEPSISTAHQIQLRPFQRQHQSFSELPVDASPHVSHGSRLSDPVQPSPSSHNLSITDADKLQQRGHETGYRGDGYRGDHRTALRYPFDVRAAFQNVGHSSAHFSSCLPQYFAGNSGTASSLSYPQRLPESGSLRTQVVFSPI